jgi:hypothetical protein
VDRNGGKLEMTVCAFGVPGPYLLRLFRRRWADRSVPAVDAAVSAIYEATVAAALRYGDAPTRRIRCAL